MKKYTFLLLFVVPFLFSCGKDDDDSGSKPKNTTVFKATIDGAAWEAESHNTASSGGSLDIYGDDGSGRQLSILTNGITATGNITEGSLSYELTHADGSYSRWTGHLDGSNYNQLTITSYDAATKKMSGTFRFKGAKTIGGATEPDTVLVTNGEFSNIQGL